MPPRWAIRLDGSRNSAAGWAMAMSASWSGATPFWLPTSFIQGQTPHAEMWEWRRLGKVKDLVMAFGGGGGLERLKCILHSYSNFPGMTFIPWSAFVQRDPDFLLHFLVRLLACRRQRLTWTSFMGDICWCFPLTRSKQGAMWSANHKTWILLPTEWHKGKALYLLCSFSLSLCCLCLPTPIPLGHFSGIILQFSTQLPYTGQFCTQKVRLESISLSSE